MSRSTVRNVLVSLLVLGMTMSGGEVSAQAPADGAEDVKFSFQRYRGVAAKLLHDRVTAVEVLDPHRVRFVLGAPWPDFLSFYKKREAFLHQIQRLMHERVIHAPIFEPATLHAVGPRVEEPAIGLQPLLYFTSP